MACERVKAVSAGSHRQMPAGEATKGVQRVEDPLLGCERSAAVREG